MLVLNSLEECRDNLRHIQSALSNFYNERGGPVFGKDKQGVWRELRAARMDRGIPYGAPADHSPDFVLRAVEVRED